MNGPQPAYGRAPAPQLLAGFLMLAGCMADCHHCGEPMAPGDYIGTWSDGTVRHAECGPWTPTVVDGDGQPDDGPDGQGDGQLTLPLLAVLDGGCP